MHGHERIVSIDLTHLVRAALAGTAVTDGGTAAVATATTPEPRDRAGSAPDAG